MKLSQIKPNPNNPRIIKDDKFKKLVKSIEEFPEMMEKRPIVCVTDVDGQIYPLGGNMRYKALKELKYKEIPDNWILMADEWTEEQRREFVIKDNVGFGEWNWEELANEWDAEKLEEWGLDLPKNKDEVNIDELFDIEIPFYTPSEIIPNFNELADYQKTKKLLNDIDLLDIDNEIKEIFKIRASFFTDFNFQKIADFYHHQNDEIKRIMRELGFVVIAPREALELGFISMKEELFMS